MPKHSITTFCDFVLSISIDISIVYPILRPWSCHPVLAFFFFGAFQIEIFIPIISRNHFHDRSTIVRFDPGSLSRKEKILTTRPHAYTYIKKKNFLVFKVSGTEEIIYPSPGVRSRPPHCHNLTSWWVE